MQYPAKDPLLMAAKTLIYFLMGMMAIAALALLVAAPAVLFMRDHVLAELGTGFPPRHFWLLPATMVIGLAIVGLVLAFLDQLRRIVATVGQGDPFAPVNAARLTRMGWLALGFTLLQVPVAMLGSFLEQLVERANSADAAMTLDGDVSVEGIVLALTLFILARVFRHGAAMREDLEGTV